MLSLALNWWQDHLLRRAGRPDLAPLGAGIAAPVLAAVSPVVRFRRARGPERQQLRWVALAARLVALRYRLYDLDRIISRALAYGLLTVLLGGGYAGLALGLGQLLGRDSSLAVAGATLTVAAAFQPVRRRVQQAVDRRFDRRRYDAAQTIQAFSDRLRQHVDLHALTVELLAVVDQTMQPTQASLWLRPSVASSHDRSGAGASSAASQPAQASLGAPAAR